jgi:hypothetical protein
VHGRADHDVAGTGVRRVQRLGPRCPGVRVAVGEPVLNTVRWLADPAGQVAGVQQGEPQPGLPGCLDQDVPHRVGVSIAVPARRVVQVVELADAGDAGQHHLGERGPGQREVGVRVEPAGHAVHLLAPGPERAAAAGVVLGPPAQGPVERVRVSVGEARQDQAGQVLGAHAAGTLADLGDPAVLHCDRHVGGQPAGR